MGIAEGGSLKGGGQYRSRMKGKLLFLAEVVLLSGFVVSMIGIMILYNQNISLQLQLEEEREHVKEVERVNNDLKMELSKLEAHNIEREGRFVEMQVTISNLRDDLLTARLSLEEKQKEVMLLRERYAEVEDAASKVSALEQVMRVKEAEIEDLKNSLQVQLSTNQKSSEEAIAAADPLENLTQTSDVGTSDKTTPQIGEKQRESGTVSVTEEKGKDGAASELENLIRNEAGIKVLKRKLKNIIYRGSRKKIAAKRKVSGRRKRSRASDTHKTLSV